MVTSPLLGASGRNQMGWQCCQGDLKQDSLLNLGVLLRLQNSEMEWARPWEGSVPFLEFPLLGFRRRGELVKRMGSWEKGLRDSLAWVSRPSTQLASYAIYMATFALCPGHIFKSLFAVGNYAVLMFSSLNSLPMFSIRWRVSWAQCPSPSVRSCMQVSMWVFHVIPLGLGGQTELRQTLQCLCCLLCCEQ